MTLYETIEKNIRQHEKSFYVGQEVTESDIRYAIRWVMRDNPDIFWFVHQYHFDKGKGKVSLNYRCSQERSSIIQKSINDVVENDFQIGYVRTLMQIEQIAYVYKWMLSYCNYNVNSAYNQNIDSVFVRRNSVCTGYAKAAQYLFNLLGIESRLIFGKLNNDKEDGRHCWNIVNIEGLYYHLDTCLGDLVLEDVMKKAGTTSILRYSDYNYNCFCVSTDEIMKTRSIEDVETLPPCNSILPSDEVERLSRIEVKGRNGFVGCLLTHIGSSADIYLCAKNRNVVLKKFRGNDSKKCEEEYGYMYRLKRSYHLLQLNDDYCDVSNNILAIEQSTPIVDLFCSHYYHPTLHGLLRLIGDITFGWLECYDRGVIYRDIHVCNIYKTNNGIYKLGDFGSCTYNFRPQGMQERVGNQWFMSPETYICGQFDERSAVYSITSVLYFILNSFRPPFMECNNEKEALQRKMNGEALPKPTLLNSFPTELAEVIMNEFIVKGCAFYPSERIRSCRELLKIIRMLISSIKDRRVDLWGEQQDMDSILNKTTPNVYIPRDVHHRFAYGEEMERKASTAASVLLKNDNIVLKGSSPFTDDVENYCRTMGVGSENDNSLPSLHKDDKSTATYKRCKNGHFYLSTNEQCPYCFRPKRNNHSENESRSVNYTTSQRVIPTTSGDSCHSRTCFCDEEVDKTITFESSVRNLGQSDIQKQSQVLSNRRRLIDLFRKKKPITYDVYSSVFAPAEIKRKSNILIQVYLHLLEETEKVKELAQESQKDAERRDYIPLQCKLKKGDKVDVLLNVYGETLLKSEKKSIIWQGSFTKCSFDYIVPKDIDVDELNCVVLLSVNRVPIGEMQFITMIVDSPRQLNPEIIAHKYSKVFISYSHMDESKVKFLHEGLVLGAVPHFFDRKYLKTGDIFPQVIRDYINSADLFILCWSENASKSEYVKKERLQALERAFPQVQPEKAAKLRIYPMSIEPRAELPSDMKENYHFGEV